MGRGARRKGEELTFLNNSLRAADLGQDRYRSAFEEKGKLRSQRFSQFSYTYSICPFFEIFIDGSWVVDFID